MEALKAYLFETIEGIKNQNDDQASANEKVSLDQAKAIVDVADAIIDIYKVQVDALKVVNNMDVNQTNLLVGMGLAGKEEVKQIQ